MRRTSSAPLLLGLVLAAAVCGCGGGGPDGERFAVYHYEEAVGPPRAEGELRCGPPRSCPGVIAQPAPREVRYDTRGSPGLDEDGIDRSGVRVLGSVVSVPLTAAGTAAFARLTREVARTGGRDQGWHHLAIVVGDEIVAFPEVDFDAHPDGIVDAASVTISAVGPEDALELAGRLRGGQ